MLRRDFLKRTGQLAAAGVWLRSPAADDALFRWERLRPDAWVVFNGGGNVLVLAERGGAIIVDCKMYGMGQLLRAEIESRVGPVAAIVMTHHHGDHSGGYLAAFAGTRAIAHAAAVPRIRERVVETVSEARNKPDALKASLGEWLARDFDVPRGAAADRAIATDVTRIASADPAAAVPAEPFTDRTELRAGNTTLELIHAGPAHTDNDLVVLDRRRGILHAGDLLFHRHHAFIDASAGGTIQGWLDALRDVRRVCNGNTVVIAGHGPTGTRAALDEQTTYFERLRDLVSRERKAGRSREAILKLPNSLFPSYGFANGWSENLEVALDELEKRATATSAR